MIQNCKTTNNSEEKILIKANQQKHRKANHHQFDKSDAYHMLTRTEQVMIFRLQTNHNWMKHHLFHKFRIGKTDKCSCSMSPQTGNHILLECPLLENLRKKTLAWSKTHISRSKIVWQSGGPSKDSCILCWLWTDHLMMGIESK